MNLNLSGKIALVTGSSVGIGRSVAIALAEAGARVAVTYYSSKEKGAEVVDAIRGLGGEAGLFYADVTSAAEMERLVANVEQAFSGTIDILVNNAGHLIRRIPNMELDEAYYHEVMDLNFKSTVFMCQKVIPGMIAKGGGKIVNMASVAAHNGGGMGSSVYAASKAAVISFSKGLAKEVAKHGIYVNIVSPGYIGNTNFHSKVTSEEARKASIEAIPLGRQGEPDDVAGAVLFLVSGLSDFITGETIEINGGVLMK